MCDCIDETLYVLFWNPYNSRALGTYSILCLALYLWDDVSQCVVIERS